MSASRPLHATDPTAPGLRYSRVTVGYGGTPIVSEVSLEVGRGEFLGLIGPNGAGKSTLLKTITGGARLLSGDLEIAGVAHDSLDAPARARIVGVVPQSPPALFAFTAREFVAMGRHAHLGRLAHESPADGAIIERVMELTDTSRLASEAVDTLSGGDLQRLTLAQALAQEPEVLLLDEPTSHLDLNHRLQVLDLVRELAGDGLAVLAVFHDLDLAARYSDRLAIVASGEIRVCGAPEEVLTPHYLSEVFAVRAVVGTDPVTGTVSVTPVVREQAAIAPHRETVFVLCGSGSGATLMRRLVLEGYRVTAGALSRGDVDRSVAEALGVEFVELPPFGQLSAKEIRAVEQLAAAADVRVVCDVPFGSGNLANLEVLERTPGSVLLTGVVDARRDFTGGAATQVWERLVLRDDARSIEVGVDPVGAIGEMFDRAAES